MGGGSPLLTQTKLQLNLANPGLNLRLHPLIPMQLKLRSLASSHADLTRDFFKFSFVRNPYDRLYSGFQQDVLAAYKLKHWEESKKPIFDRIGEDFNRYVIEYVTRADIRNDPFWICFAPCMNSPI
ncbi:hypothetical protein GHK45_02275 [Sinorhizobium meliloti]|uniref:Sulfotransferase family protein n=1 Tax=Rhizobium meliloti TaxID=382 RepID=A0A6A7ZKF0_RHIML|nr:hypothetical protein [Sinorhizobium meliloti]